MPLSTSACSCGQGNLPARGERSVSKELWGQCPALECDRRTRNDIGVNLKRLQAGFNGIFGEGGGVEPQLLLEPEERLVAILLRLAQHVRQEVAGRQRTACTPENTTALA